MPMRRNVKFGESEREFTRQGLDINWFDEGKEPLTRRVQLSVADPAEVTVKCRFLIYRNRVETETDLLVGKREDVLAKNLTFFF